MNSIAFGPSQVILYSSITVYSCSFMSAPLSPVRVLIEMLLGTAPSSTSSASTARAFTPPTTAVTVYSVCADTAVGTPSIVPAVMASPTGRSGVTA